MVIKMYHSKISTVFLDSLAKRFEEPVFLSLNNSQLSFSVPRKNGKWTI